MMIVKDGKPERCLLCDDGQVIFYDEELLEPLSDIIGKGEYFQMTVRTKANGDRYIAIKDGLLLIAVIMPREVITEEYLDGMHSFLIKCSEQLERGKKLQEAKEMRMSHEACPQQPEKRDAE